MITTHNVDIGASFHPSARGILVVNPTADPDAFVIAAAESTQVVGTPLPIVASGTHGLGPAGFLPCTPCSVAFTPSAALTSTYRLTGIDQFDKQVSEDVVVAAAVVHSSRAYKQIISIIPIITGVSANTLSVGLSLAAGFKVALPFRPANALQGGTTLASFLQRIEFVGMTLVPSAATSVFVQTAAASVNERFATIQFAAAATAGLNLLLTKYINKGFRDK